MVRSCEVLRLFPSLYRLKASKSATVSERLTGDRVSWRWIREPMGRTTNELDALLELIASVSLDSNNLDSWRWGLSSDGTFTVKKLSTLVDVQLLGPIINVKETRNNLVPKKVKIFIWRALKKKIPVRLELDKRGIDLHSVRCPLCDDDLESVDHSVIFCNRVYDIWNRVYNWWNLGNVPTSSLEELLNIDQTNQGSKQGRMILQAICWTCAYLVWKNRKSLIFQNKAWNSPVSLNEIQVKSFEWNSNRAKGRNFDWQTWIRNPSIYLL
ncbi:uncharacterized protein [Rutidosis leptorrhynchoides]|uniref:uncharacterized protein n=1 Tax=Rutidosis leptorrhynchoides TaxID=125765 RepID=UPI003A9A6024